MASSEHPSKPDAYWERAGEVGYARAMYSSPDVATHVRYRLWREAIEIASAMGVAPAAHVLDFGCGDGAFANELLATRYAAVVGVDKAQAAIARARAGAPGAHVHFQVADLVLMDYAALPRYDAAFLMGILHHVKSSAARLVRALADRTDKMIVLEPNGNHLLRKLLELTPSYRRAGEDSFRTKELIALFAAAGFRAVVARRINLFPNFTPGFIYRSLAWVEPRIEANAFGRALCTVDLCGFERVTAGDRADLRAR